MTKPVTTQPEGVNAMADTVAPTRSSRPSLALLLLAPVLFGAGCSSRTTAPLSLEVSQVGMPNEPVQMAFGGTATSSDQDGSSLMQSGTLSLTRPLPAAIATEQLATSSLLAFVPIPRAIVGTWISIDRKKRSVSLMQGETVLQTVAGQGVESLNPGKYTVEHKQRSALWYAPAEYFTSRGLPVPPEGVKERYLRGALGDFALFLDQMTPLHNGPIWSKELGGVRFDESDISRIYYQVEVGAPVEVR